MNDTSVLWQEAEALAGSQKWDAAHDRYSRIIQIHPDHAPALLQLSYLESMAGRYRSARDFAVGAARSATLPPSSMSELLSRLRTFNEAEAFHGCLARLPSLSKIGIAQLIAIAAQLSYFNEQEKALRFLDEARRGDPEYPPTLVARGHVLIYLGRFEEAHEDLRRCVKRAPRLAQAWWLLSRLDRKLGRDSRIADLRRLLATGRHTPDDFALLYFALHNELDARGDHAAAWHALEQACRAKRARLRYEAADTAALVDSLISMAKIPGSQPGMGAVTNGVTARQPIFIVGMHRSGTTLLEHLLDGHGDVRGLGELYDFTHQMRLACNHHCRGVTDQRIVASAGQIDFAAVGAGYLAGIEWRLGGEKYFVDKLPSNFLNVGFICQALPQARILHMRRDPVETCFSNLRELFSDACPYSYDQQELAQYHRQYGRLMQHWQQAFPGRILEVDYADLVRDTETVLRHVADYCGIEFDPAMLDRQRASRGVATASAVQVRKERVLPAAPKWMAYEDQLGPLIQGLAE